jgi:hypothetical protein
MNSRKILTSLLLSVSMLLPVAGQAANLISVIIADTKDSSIGASVQSDFTHMQKKTAEIAKYTNLKEVKTHVRGSEATPKRLERILEELKVGKNDVVVFFYAGHSYHPSEKKKTTPWPDIIFSTGGKSVPYESVLKKLEKKKPRLLLAISDSCNNLLSRDVDEPEDRAAGSKADSHVLEHNYKQLFLETTGTIKVVSSSVGESSWGGSSGGVFTNAFLARLDKAVESHNGIDWKAILKDASKQTTQKSSGKMNSSQHPYYEIKVKS